MQKTLFSYSHYFINKNSLTPTTKECKREVVTLLPE